MTKWKLPDWLGSGELEGREAGRDIVFDIPEFYGFVFALPRFILTEVIRWPAGTFFVDKDGDCWIVDKDLGTGTILSYAGGRSGREGMHHKSQAYIQQHYGPLTRLVPESTKDTP